jgi:hypothetical protein
MAEVKEIISAGKAGLCILGYFYATWVLGGLYRQIEDAIGRDAIIKILIVVAVWVVLFLTIYVSMEDA